MMEGGQNAKRGGVTAKVYLEVLPEYLLTILEHDSIFMQDNAPIHKAHKVTEFFEEMGIEVMVESTPTLNLQNTSESDVSISELITWSMADIYF